MNGADAIKDILATAVYAPSGDNAQPWRFECTEDTIAIFNLPERDETLYNFRQRGSYIGHGALLENIIIAAEHRGYDTSVILFPGPKDCVAKVKLSLLTPRVLPIYGSITKRSTNRKPYDSSPLPPAKVGELRNSVKHFSGIKLSLIENRADIEKLAVAISTNERVLMENRHLHDFLFGMIRWSPKEEEIAPGLFIKTMEFPKPLQMIMKYVIAHWGALKFLNKIGFSRMVSKQSSAGYTASAAIGAITVNDLQNESFIEAGRAFQRIWLTATSAGLYIQPVTAIPYLAQRLEANEAGMFTLEHRTFIRDAYSTMSALYHLQRNEHIAMLFRIGKCAPPTAPSRKLPPDIRFV